MCAVQCAKLIVDRSSSDAEYCRKQVKFFHGRGGGQTSCCCFSLLIYWLFGFFVMVGPDMMGVCEVLVFILVFVLVFIKIFYFCLSFTLILKIVTLKV